MRGDKRWYPKIAAEFLDSVLEKGKKETLHELKEGILV